MSEIAKDLNVDIILAPFLTKTVPDDVYNNPSVPCIIVHPGIEGDRGRHSLDWALRQQLPEWGVTLLQAAEEMDAGLCRSRYLLSTWPKFLGDSIQPNGPIA